jgi:hypothetical protein
MWAAWPWWTMAGVIRPSRYNPRFMRDPDLRGVCLAGALAILRLGGYDCEPELLTHGPRQESAHGVRLPARSFDQFRQRGSIGPLQQVQDFGCLTAIAAADSILSRFGRFLGCPGLWAPSSPSWAQRARAVRQHDPSCWPWTSQCPLPGRFLQHSVYSCDLLVAVLPRSHPSLRFRAIASEL